MVSNKKDCTWINKCNLKDEEEEEKPQDIIYLVLKGVLKELVIKVQVAKD